MSLYRNGVWFIKGLREYTKSKAGVPIYRSGYENAAKEFRKDDLDVDCKGSRYMITGSNSGIGKCVAAEIAQRGGIIHMVCRNEERGEEARKEIMKISGSQEIFLHVLDLSDSQKIVEFGRRFAALHDCLDVLVNNAGCMINERQLTDDGLEKNFATNTFGTYLLTTTLIPALKKSRRPRVVIVSSGGMLVQKLNTDDLQSEKIIPFMSTMAYAQNKRQQVVMTEQCAKRYPEIQFSCMHPGWADTPAVRASMPEFYDKMKERLRTASQGADTVIWLAISPAALEEHSGQFFQDRRVVATHLPLAWTRVNPSEEEKFMNALNELAAKYHP